MTPDFVPHDTHAAADPQAREARRKRLILAVVAGAVGSVGLMLRAGRSTPRLLLVLFVIWVLSPFVALAWANMVSSVGRWSREGRSIP